MMITKEGALASFYTVNKEPIKHLKVYFSPKQAGEGTPSPSNVREIEGWNGVKVYDRQGVIPIIPLNWNSATDKGITISYIGNNTFNINGIATNHKSFEIPINNIMTKLNTNYTCIIWIETNDSSIFSNVLSNNNANALFALGTDKGSILTLQLHLSSRSPIVITNIGQFNSNYLTSRIMMAIIKGNGNYKLHVELIEEPKGVYDTTWSSNLDTIYGGYVDLVTGELVQEYVSFTFDENTQLNFTYNSFQELSTRIYTVVPLVHDTTADCYVSNASSGAIFDGTMRWYRQGIKEFNLYIPTELTGITSEDTNDSATTKIKAFLANNPTQYVYKLATPITHQLTPTTLQTLIGRNNIWSNADRVEVEYDLAESNDELYRRRNILLRSTPHIETASGNIAHFETDIAAPIKSAKISFSPVQEGSGDPSPTNVRPISGFINLSLYHSGENLYVPNSNNKGYISKSGVITVDETSTYTDLIPVNLGDVYSFECTTVSVNGDTNRRIHGYNSSGTWVKQLASGTTAANTVEYRKISATIPADISYIRVSFRNQDTDVRITKENVVTADWQTAAGTIYGGYVDLINGILVQTHAHTVLDGSFAPAIFPWGKEYIDKNTGETLVNILYRKSDTGDNIHNGNFEYFYADSLKQISIYRTNEMGISMYDGDTYSICLTLPKNLVGSTNETLALYLSEHPCEVVFTLKTPITHTLTPAQLKSLKGTNNIWSNTNETIEVKYWRH